ncbi:MAG TPA: FHA domain-containing protein [Steroidobacteraceae bacterium]|nr:FHA domain-containing protein [Steroidobacteraceae bacterium]
MDPRLRPPAQGSPPPGTDLDSTDELPVLDPKAYEAAARDHLADTWIQPGLPPREAAAEPPPVGAEAGEDPLQTAAANLREAQELLSSRGARLAEIERTLEEARAVRAGAERRVEQLTEELTAARAAAQQRETERAAQEAEARAAAERREAQHAGDLAEVRAAAAQRESELGEELARARAAAGQQASGLAEELAQAGRAAEQREAEHVRELAAQRAAGEQRLLAEREAAAEAQCGRDLEREQALAARDRAQAALQGELEEMRARAASCFESFQSAERRRSLFEGLLSDLQDEVDGHETSRARLARELASRDVRAGELESDLSQRAARIADLDSQVSVLAAALQQRDVELTRLRAVEAGLTTALEASRAATATVTTRAGEHETALGEARTRLATLEAELAAARRRGAELEEELTKVRSDMEEWAGAVRAAQVERSGHLASIAAGDARGKQLEDRVAEQVDMLRTLQTASDAAIERTRELEADLRAAEEAIGRLESQLRSRNVRVSELEKANQQWRHTLDETRAAHIDTDTHLALREAAHAVPEEGVAREPAPEGATRLLIRSDGEREVMHVLGRKTSVGRTPDNDLQIDAKYVSRHHAVILAGPAHTIVEDLNSTNGVLVNGRRIVRETLKDGDLVTIGRAEYRFALRRTGDKR